MPRWTLPGIVLGTALTMTPAQPFGAQRTFSGTGTIFATIGHSEWCPAGNVMLDLQTGRYALTSRASRTDCVKPNLERPIVRKTLDRKSLELIREGFMRARVEGLGESPCRNRVFFNGGARVLVLTNGAQTWAARDDLGCWSKAANDLQYLLDRTFAPEDYIHLQAPRAVGR